MAGPGLARFAGGSALDALRAKVAQPVAATGLSAARRIPLAAIDEDPNQPRRHFDDDALARLAESIRMVGVLQPVGVRQAEGGRYLLRWGARRVRASKLAGLADVPAVLVGAEQAGLEAQVIENRHRAENTDTELAAAVDAMTARGMTNVQIAVALALPDAQSLKHYRALAKVREVPELAPWIDRADVRALYELHNAWHRDEGALRPAIAETLARADELTVTSARRIVEVAKAQAAQVAESPAAVEADSGAVPAGIEADTPPVRAADTIAPEPETASRLARRRSAPAPADDPAEVERVAKVRAWLDDARRPRPPLNV